MVVTFVVKFRQNERLERGATGGAVKKYISDQLCQDTTHFRKDWSTIIPVGSKRSCGHLTAFLRLLQRRFPIALVVLRGCFRWVSLVSGVVRPSFASCSGESSTT
nr:hypothetical protein CFP56_02775 [Quercus suber]